jgi:hypothetical protein
VYAGYRLYETMSTRANNTKTGQSMTNILTDTGWISGMNRYQFGLMANAGLRCQLSRRFSLMFGLGFQQGLTSLDTNEQVNFTGTRYMGQYNPLWGAPGKTTGHSFHLSAGAAIRLNKEVK